MEPKDLQVGDLLQTEDGRVVDVDKIEKREGEFKVYNFRVEGIPTYLVSDFGILVHNNTNCPPGSVPGGTWNFDPKRDLDLRGGTDFREALEEAFKRTGVPREEFEITKTAPDRYGKTIPVEWRVTKGANKGAEVNIDDPSIVPSSDRPAPPHIGYQTPGKRSAAATRGHIIVDSVPASRGRL